MECFPPCRVCTGLCQQKPAARAITPGSQQTRGSVHYGAGKDGYVELGCGHFTTPEEQVIFGNTRRGKYWCDKCNGWKVKARKRNETNNADTPMF